jgi:hypothetical protein
VSTAYAHLPGVGMVRILDNPPTQAKPGYVWVIDNRDNTRIVPRHRLRFRKEPKVRKR